MSAPTCNGAPVQTADVVLPYEGAWTADVVCDLDVVPRRVSLDLLGVAYSGTVLQGDLLGGSCYLRVVGGAGGLETVLPPRAYRWPVPVQQVLQDLAQEAGEVLVAALPGQLPRWTRARGPVRDQLHHLLDERAVWRVRPDGQLWAGSDTWTEAAVEDWTLISARPSEGRWTVAAEVAPWQPGQLWQGRRITQVHHYVTKASSRTTLCCDESGGLAALVRGELARARVPFLRQVPCSVVAQTAEGLQLRPMDQDYPELTGVPIAPGIPAAVRVAPGARCLLTWADGDASQPQVTGWISATPLEVSIGGSTPVGRVGDAVALDALLSTWIGQVTTAVNGLAPGAVTAAPTRAGTIAAGSSILRCG